MVFIGTKYYQLHAYLFWRSLKWGGGGEIDNFCFRYVNNLIWESILTMQAHSILATHLIYKWADCMPSLWQTGFLLAAWIPGGGMTFPPHFEQQSHCLCIIHTSIQYCLIKTVPSVASCTARSSLCICRAPEFVLVFSILEKENIQYNPEKNRNQLMRKQKQLYKGCFK